VAIYYRSLCHVNQPDKHEIIEFKMMGVEKPVVIDDVGTTIPGLTYNGSVPGPLMVVHEGDYVELTLVNPATNTMTHTIDFHCGNGSSRGSRTHAG
jgi:nitrite reductase (NO-forming)